MLVGSSPVADTQTSDIAPFLCKDFLNIQVTIECGLTLKRACDMIRKCSQLGIGISDFSSLLVLL